MINKCDLPLNPEKLAEITNFCGTQIETGRFRVLLDKIPDVLRKDWLNEKLSVEDRANKHINVDPAVWRASLETICDVTVEGFSRCGRNEIALAFLMWRAALAYSKSLATHGIKQCHADVKRNERTLEIREHMPLSLADKEVLCSLLKDGRVLIPDPMLASGSSMLFAIDALKGCGIEENQITIACVVSAPEGVSNLLTRHPDIKIITGVVDDCLNRDAYITPGLGDAGEKYFCGNSLENFPREMFTDAQWAHLRTYFA